MFNRKYSAMTKLDDWEILSDYYHRRIVNITVFLGGLCDVIVSHQNICLNKNIDSHGNIDTFNVNKASSILIKQQYDKFFFIGQFTIAQLIQLC